MKDNTLEAAVPVYISNLCDSVCSMCNMNKQNNTLVRIDGSREEIGRQLAILYHKEHIRWIMILSGEYKKGDYRKQHLKRVVQTANDAFHMGFERVTLNIGSLEGEEIEMLYCNVCFPDKVGLAIFQETYNREVYEQKFGTYSKDIPKTDYDGRRLTPERWLQRGFSMINLGILLETGQSDEDVKSLICHAKKLKEQYSCSIQISLPRIVQNHHEWNDDAYIHMIKHIKESLPWADIIMTTREKKDFIAKALPYIDVISPGTSEVLGYTDFGAIGNDPDKSQFFVQNKRERPSETLSYFEKNYNINFNFYKNKGEI